MTAKYVVLDYSAIHGETIFIFPESVTHKSFSLDMAATRPIVSAGFVHKSPMGKLHCYGRSESLGIDSRPGEDSLLANLMFGGKEGHLEL